MIKWGNPDVPPMLLGDSAFPDQFWLQKPYASSTLLKKQQNFNYCFSRARMVRECAFSQLKGRRRRLYWKSEVRQHSLKITVSARITLHHIWIEKGDSIPRKSDLTFDEDSIKWKASAEIRTQLVLIYLKGQQHWEIEFVNTCG